MLTKEEAAQFLGKSTRAVERYVKAGKLTARYEKNEKTSYAVYDEKELESLKAELEGAPYPMRPAVEAVSNGKPAAPGGSQSLALTATRSDADLAEFVGLVTANVGARLFAALEASKHGERPPLVSLTDLDVKLVLSLAEASALSGLSKDRLAQACQAGMLKAKKNAIGRGWRVKRADLDAYVKSL